MSAISPGLLKTIRELQSFESFEGSALGGGTNLAIRYHHRISTDIDIFFPHIIGNAGYERINGNAGVNYQNMCRIPVLMIN